jgi:hypothetical protein
MQDCRTYLLETYLPNTCAGGPAAAAARARRTAEEMSRQSTTIRVLDSFFLPEDELCYCLCEANSIDDVAEFSRRADLGFERIQPAVRLRP